MPRASTARRDTYHATRCNHPASDCRPRPSPALRQRQKHRLGRILGVGGISKNAPADANHHSSVAVHNFSKGRFLPAVSEVPEQIAVAPPDPRRFTCNRHPCGYPFCRRQNHICARIFGVVHLNREAGAGLQIPLQSQNDPAIERAKQYLILRGVQLALEMGGRNRRQVNR